MSDDNGFNWDAAAVGAGVVAAGYLARQNAERNRMLWHSMTPAQQAAYLAEQQKAAEPAGFALLLNALLTLFFGGCLVYEPSEGTLLIALFFAFCAFVSWSRVRATLPPKPQPKVPCKLHTGCSCNFGQAPAPVQAPAPEQAPVWWVDPNPRRRRS